MNKKFRLLLVLSLFISGIFINVNSVKAEDDSYCGSYQCITCEANLYQSSVKGIWSVSSKGNGTGSVNFKLKVTDNKVTLNGTNYIITDPTGVKITHKVNNNILYTSFVNDEKLGCPEMYVEVDSSGARSYTVTENISTSSAGNKNKLTVTKVSDNNKPLYDKSASSRSCEYTSNGVKISIVADLNKPDEKPTSSATKNYTPSVREDMTNSLFKDECPNLGITCFENASIRQCTIQKTVGPGMETSEPTDGKGSNAKTILKGYQKIQKQAGIEVGTSGCDLIK